MITPAEIKKKALQHWQSGRLLSAWLKAEELFPLDLRFRKLTGKAALEQFAELRSWVNNLHAGSKECLGYGYTLELIDSNHRLLGQQRLPGRIGFDSLPDLLRCIGKQEEFARFCALTEETLIAQPSLRGWLEENPLKLLKHLAVWEQLLKVCDYFCKNPRPELYLRELEIPDVDSKFIEGHKRILRELLDQLLPAATISAEITSLAGNGFERRFGLRYDEPLIRLRILDSMLTAPLGVSDLSVPLSQFRKFNPPCSRVFITENKINGLSFPPLSTAAVIFGLGYGIQALKGIPWLHEKPIYYWGDIDTHGFAILSQLRGYYPQTRSLLMDRETLLRGQSLWVSEEPDKRCLTDLPHLDEEEQRLYRDLCCNRWGENIRLEQERIAFSRLQEWLDESL